jgi:hypothetical protein
MIESWVELGILRKYEFGHGKSINPKGLVRKVCKERFGKKGLWTNYNSQQCMELLLLVPTNNNLYPYVCS